MNRHTALAEAAATHAAEPGSHQHPQLSVLLTGLLLGFLAGIAAGLLHRKDGASVPSSVVRGGTAFVGATPLSVVSLVTRTPSVTLALLLGATVISVTIAVLHRMDGMSVPTSIWRGGLAFAAVAGLGQLLVGLYVPSATATAMGFVHALTASV
ncbi:hypothetical protein ACFYNZ_16830 [Streptomyces kebangsaanensis]|uniref:Uncharacterized protein n=1 Tax=Streptomyces kebangsaanensis TaxID=864058 RepID=A0ABW6KXN7_9ACTN